MYSERYEDWKLIYSPTSKVCCDCIDSKIKPCRNGNVCPEKLAAPHKVSFKMAHMEDGKEEFIKFWSNLLGMDPKKLEKEWIVDENDLFDDDINIGY
jgi:hypothetical protein